MTLVVFGSANADIIFRLPGLPAPGETVLGQAGHAIAGGKGLNQAVAAARAGAAVRFAGCVGADAHGAMLRAALAGAQVDTACLAEAAEPTGLAAVLVDRQGRNQIAVSSGANGLALGAAAPVIAGGVLLLQMEVPAAENTALMHRARAAGMRIILNLAPAAALPGLPEILVLNEVEAGFLAAGLGCSASATALHASLGCTVLRTLGAAGAEAASAEGDWLVPGFAVAVADTVGAGDAWCGALAADLLRGVALAPAMRFANAAGALACTRAGAWSAPLAAISALAG